MDVMDEALAGRLMTDNSELEAVCRGYMDGRHRKISSMA